MKVLSLLKNLVKQRGIYSAERPSSLDSDALVRYVYAIPHCKGKSVLDIGTGLGLGAEFIASRGALKVVGIDYNGEVVKNNNVRNSSNRVKYKHLDALNINNIGEKFDVVLAFEIIEHLPTERVDNFINAITCVLKRSGTLLLTTPNGLKTDFLFGKPYNPYHIKEYTGYEIAQMLKGNFNNVQIKGISDVSKGYQKKQAELEGSLLYKPVYVLGHFKIVRELVAYIPKSIKQFVTKENKLPKRSEKDYKLVKNWKNCSGLFVYAKRRDVISCLN